MFKMWLGKFIRRIIFRKSKGESVSGVQGNRKEESKDDSISAEYPRMEAEHRRLHTRTSLREFTRRLWDEGQKLRTVGRLLQKQPMGSREDEEIQRRKEKASERNARLARFCKTEEYRVLTEFLKSIEEDAYLNLRQPETAKDTKVVTGGVTGQTRYANSWISTDYHIGKQNGRLETIEDIRSMFMQALLNKAKEDALQNPEERK